MVPADSDGISPVPPYSGSCPGARACPYGAITPCGLPSQVILVRLLTVAAVLQPPGCLNNPDLGSSPFARHYWGNHDCFLFLRLLRCFSSPGWPPVLLRDMAPSAPWVAPFGHPRINPYLPVPAVFRSLSRPSSPLRA